MEYSQPSYQFCPDTTELEELYTKERHCIINELADNPSGGALRRAMDQVEGLSRYLTHINMTTKEPELIAFIKYTQDELAGWHRIFEGWLNNFQSFRASMLITKLENYLDPIRRSSQNTTLPTALPDPFAAGTSLPKLIWLGVYTRLQIAILDSQPQAFAKST